MRGLRSLGLAAGIICWSAAIAWAAGEQSSGTIGAPPGGGASALGLLSSPPAGTIRQRALHMYRMPDGVIWDGWNQQEFRRIVSRNLRAHDRIERGRPAPGATIVEDRVVGTVWRFRRNADTEAWGVFETLAEDRDGNLRWAYSARARGRNDLPLLATADPRRWKDAPPLWSSAEAPDFSWRFALIDEQDPDPWTKAVPGSYLRITREWGNGRYEIEGHSTDLGRIEGIVTVPDPLRQVRRDRLRGVFFLWPRGSVSEPGGYARESWDYIPADELRITADELAAALIDGAAEIIEWRHKRVSGRLMWQRTVKPVEIAPVMVMPPQRPPHVPPPAVGQEGPDLLVLHDGRWFRGRLVERRDERVRFATTIGGLETVLEFEAGEVSELQNPERPPP
jgi:hypothetical protein